MKIILILLIMSFLTVHSEATELKIGLIPEQNVFIQVSRYKPLGEYIEKKTGIKIKFTILSRYGNIIDHFIIEKMDGAFFGSFTGAMAIEKLRVDPIARPVNLDGNSSYRGYIFVRKDSGIKTLADMKNKRVVFVEKATLAGYVFPIALFREKGIIDIGKYFKEYYFAGSHDAAIDAVLNKKADIGCAKDSVLDRVVRREPGVANDLKILFTSPGVPSNGLLVRKDLSVSVRNQLAEVLLNMDKDGEGREVLKKFEALRFIPTVKDDYKTVYEISAKAGIDLRTYKFINK